MIPSLLENQLTLYKKIKELVGPGAADFFEDACHLMNGTLELKATTHFVGHALREIESSLRDVLEPLSSKVGESGSSNHRQEITSILTALEIAEDKRLMTT
jgi:hypothetical protein